MTSKQRTVPLPAEETHNLGGAPPEAPRALGQGPALAEYGNQQSVYKEASCGLAEKALQLDST